MTVTTANNASIIQAAIQCPLRSRWVAPSTSGHGSLTLVISVVSPR